MSHTLCDELLELLHGICVKRIFGITGDALNPFVDAIRRDGRFEWITVRHEEAGAFAASAQAKLTGRLAVCAGTVGPGGLHLLNGLYDAKKEYAPVLAITGQVPESEYGNNYHQEVNLEAVFNDVCVYNQVVRSADQFRRLAQQAIQTALNEGGVAHLNIPVDIISRPLPDDGGRRRMFYPRHEITPSDETLDDAAAVLNRSGKVTILAGAGCADAQRELLDTARLLQAPITHALRGTDILPYTEPHRIGGIGHLGTPQGNEALAACDALLMVGTDFPYRAYLPDNADIIQIDVRSSNIGRRCAVDHALVGHARPTLQALARRLQQKDDKSFLSGLQARRGKWDQHMDRKADIRRSKDVIHPQSVMRMAGDLANDDAVFVSDVGTVTVWAARQLRLRQGQRLLGCFNHGSLGGCMPAAMGIQSIDTERQVIAVCGDGGFGMTMADFITAVKYDLPIIVIIFNNSKFSFVELEMQAAGYPRYATELTNPDFAKYADICGGEGVRITRPDEVRPAIERALASRKPFLIDAIVNPDELVMPPSITAAEAWGFAVGKTKELWLEMEDKLKDS
jgi:pyruvate dehydrogenase (quinone)